MFFLTSNILCFTFFYILIQIQSLFEVATAENSNIAATEWAIRNTVNNLFSTLKLDDAKQKLKFKQFSIVHNFFVSVTLQDHDNLENIARLTKVENIDNSTEVFITQLNEVLNEDNKSDEVKDAVYITSFINNFVQKVEYLKSIYGLKSNVTNFNISKDVIKHLSNDQNVFENVTKLNNNSNVNVSNNNVLSENEFWQESGRRIFEGHRVKIKRFPFMASIQFFKTFQCGGSIIKSDLVITSASCLQLAWNNRFYRENPAFLSVIVGSSYYEAGDENIAVIEIYFHPNYNPKNLKHNLAIVRLHRHLLFHRKEPRIKKIDFDRNPWPLPDNTDAITVIGWGARSTVNTLETPFKNQLSFAVLEFYPLRECQEIYSKDYVTNRNFCAGYFSKGGGACNRDAGGPGIVHGILTGVISFGSPTCGAPDAPTVFTKLGYYTEWIEEIMEQKAPKSKIWTTARPPKITVYSVPYAHSAETTTFKVIPIFTESDSDIIMPPSIINKRQEHLRTVSPNNIFTDFLETIFESEEMKEYLRETNSNKEKQNTDVKPKKYDKPNKIEKPNEDEKLDLVTKQYKGEVTIKDKTKYKNKSKTKLKSGTNTKKSKSKPKSKRKPKLKHKLKTKSKPKSKYISKTKSKSKLKTYTKSKVKTNNKSKLRTKEKTKTTKKPITAALLSPKEKKSIAKTEHRAAPTKSQKKHTKHEAIKENLNSEDDEKLEEAIISLMDNLDLEDLLEDKSDSSQNLFSSEKSHEKDLQLSPEERDNKKIIHNKKQITETESDEPATATKSVTNDLDITDSILTLLYLTDEKQNIGNKISNNREPIINNNIFDDKAVTSETDHSEGNEDNNTKENDSSQVDGSEDNENKEEDDSNENAYNPSDESEEEDTEGDNVDDNDDDDSSHDDDGSVDDDGSDDDNNGDDDGEEDGDDDNVDNDGTYSDNDSNYESDSYAMSIPSNR